MAKFKLALETALFARMPLGDALEKASGCGFGMVEVGLSHFDACVAGGPDVEALGELLSRNGLGLAALFALPGWSLQKRTKLGLGLSSPDEAERAKAVVSMGHALDVAKALGCRSVTSELSGDMDDPAASRRSFVRSIGELLPRLEEESTTVFFEAHPGDFIEDSFRAVELLASFRSERVRYNYCVPHTFILGHTPEEIVRNAGRHLGHVHLADTLRPDRIFFSPTHPPKVKPHLHMVPGEGDVDLGEVLSSLLHEDFRGYVSAQPFSDADDPVRAAKRTRAVV
ncbi:MAG: sugar phosphate isomerase/epimerase family protein, partial [Nitrososphaerales archaeon]